ncbi:MAG TPA: hypothetical protein VLZ32_08610, partial [Rhodanobacter sp.]|nr:hypothetical protein [Rhodanobacter sp.]
MPYDSAALAMLCLPFLASVVVLMVRGRQWATWLMIATAAACLLLAVGIYPAMDGGHALRHVV